MNYFSVYEKLYKLGYHSKLKNHGQKYVDLLVRGYEFKTILEIGCSNGMAVQQFRKKRKLAYGIDVSSIAIRYAAEKAFVPNCIIASATDIPFVDNFVDAIFSCDVLEHLEEKDVFKALGQIKRLTKRYLFLVIDTEIERNRDWIEKAKETYSGEFQDIENLHITVWPIRKWKKVISDYGFKLINSSNDLYIFEKE